jgi:hypothetical protein
MQKWLRRVAVPSEQLRVLELMVNSRTTVEQVVNIVKIKEPVDVYDLTVENHEHFTANGIVVHNCKHLLALRAFVQKKHGI